MSFMVGTVGFFKTFRFFIISIIKRDWKKKLEEFLLNPLIRGDVTYDIEEDICGENVFALTNRSFLETIHEAKLKKSECMFFLYFVYLTLCNKISLFIMLSTKLATTSS